MAESFSEMMASFTIFLGAIAGVSLVVGSVGIGIAMFIGVISGLIPAYNASKMKPVGALRYE
jgi:ABC-type antimicrobial peptide transport system permease subunit